MKDTIYCAVNINDVLDIIDKVHFDLYIKIAGKTIKLEHRENNQKVRLLEYQKKGLKEVYVNKVQYQDLLNKLCRNMKEKFFAPRRELYKEDIIETLDRSYQLVKKAVQNIGLSEVTVEMAQEVHKQSLRFIQKTPNVFKFFIRYKNTAGAELLKSMMTGYTLSAMLDTFNWSSDKLKDKVAIAVILCDVLLEGDEISIAKNHKRTDKNKLPEKVLNHINDTIKLINRAVNRNLLSNEVVQIVEQHHERPDGTGYPAGLHAMSINILPACYIVADNFVELCFDKNFQEEAIDEILDELSNQYNTGSFKKSYRALSAVISN